MLGKLLLRRHDFGAFYTSVKQLRTIAWSDKLFVNYLKLPNLHGPTAEEITKDIDLTNKTCLITGGTSGIGVEVVRCLMERNCKIVMACRNPYAANVLARNTWGDQTSQLTTYKTNLASFASVKKATRNILKEQSKIDILILSAAVFGIPWTLTEDGIETIFQVNFLSQFYMLMNIDKILAPDARVVIMTSDSHRNVRWSMDHIVSPYKQLVSLPKDEYTSIKAYNISSLCAILAMHYYGFKWTKTGKSIFCCHPGSFVKTKLCTNWWPYEALYTLMYPFSKSIAQAAAIPLYCATSPELNGLTDIYIKNFKSSELGELAHDTHLAYRIVGLSKSLIQDVVGFEDDIVKEVKETIEKPSEEIKPETIKTQIGEPALSA